MPTFTTFIQHSIGNPSHSNQREKEIKGIQIEREEVKLSLFADDMILYTGNHKDTTKKLLEITNKFSKVARYKVNIQTSVMVLYTNNKLSEKFKKQPSLQLHQKE